jgi:hypothetical protein
VLRAQQLTWLRVATNNVYVAFVILISNWVLLNLNSKKLANKYLLRLYQYHSTGIHIVPHSAAVLWTRAAALWVIYFTLHLNFSLRMHVISIVNYETGGNSLYNNPTP